MFSPISTPRNACPARSFGIMDCERGVDGRDPSCDEWIDMGLDDLEESRLDTLGDFVP